MLLLRSFTRVKALGNATHPDTAERAAAKRNLLRENERGLERYICREDEGGMSGGGKKHEQKTAEGEGSGKQGGEEESHEEKKWERRGWLDGGKQLESEEERGEVRRGDVSRADGLRERRSKFHAVMSLQKPEM